MSTCTELKLGQLSPLPELFGESFDVSNGEISQVTFLQIMTRIAYDHKAFRQRVP